MMIMITIIMIIIIMIRMMIVIIIAITIIIIIITIIIIRSTACDAVQEEKIAPTAKVVPVSVAIVPPDAPVRAGRHEGGRHSLSLFSLFLRARRKFILDLF